MPVSVKKCVDDAKAARRERSARVRKALTLPQRRVPLWEIAIYLILPAALIVMECFPLAGLYLVPAALVLLYFLYRRLGIYLPLFALACYGAAALTLNYDVISLVYVIFLSGAFIFLVAAMQHKNYLVRAALTVALCALSFFAGVYTVSLAEDKRVPDVCAAYICANADDAIISDYIDSKYEKSDMRPDERVKKDDPAYKAAATEYTANEFRDDIEGYVPYYCIHFGALFGLIAFFAATLINGYSASPFDENVTEGDIHSSRRALGGAYKDKTRASDMRLPRLYLLITVLPALIASIVLGIAGGHGAQSATVMHACITLPSEFAFVTLVMYIAALFTGKGRVIAIVIASALLLCNVFFSIVLLVCSIFGVCDVILNLRYWISFLAKDDD